MPEPGLGNSAPQQTPPPAASDPPAAPRAADPNSGGAAAAGDNDPAAAPGSSPPDGDNWRTGLAGTDEALLRELARFKTPADFAKAYAEQKKTLSKRAEAPKLPADATPQQIADYRKLMGVPDTVDGYGVAAPEGYEVSEVEKAMLGDFAKAMHGKHAPAGLVKEATDFFFRAQAANAQALNQLDLDRQSEWQGELQKKLGKDYDNMLAAGEQFLNQRFSENPEAKNVLLNARLPGGGRLGDHPAFIEMMVDLALNNGFTDRIEAADIETSGGKSLSEQQRDLEQLQFKDPSRYNLPEVQGKLNKLIELRLSRGEIDEQGNEVRRRRTA